MSRTVAPSDPWWKQEGREEKLEYLFRHMGKSDAEIAREFGINAPSVLNKRVRMDMRRQAPSPPGRYRPSHA